KIGRETVADDDGLEIDSAEARGSFLSKAWGRSRTSLQDHWHARRASLRSRLPPQRDASQRRPPRGSAWRSHCCLALARATRRLQHLGYCLTRVSNIIFGIEPSASDSASSLELTKEEHNAKGLIAAAVR